MSKVIDFRTEKDKLYLKLRKDNRYITCMFILTEHEIELIKKYKRKFDLEDINYALREMIIDGEHYDNEYLR
jgi:hypothetical protein